MTNTKESEYSAILGRQLKIQFKTRSLFISSPLNIPQFNLIQNARVNNIITTIHLALLIKDKIQITFIVFRIRNEKH